MKHYTVVCNDTVKAGQWFEAARAHNGVAQIKTLPGYMYQVDICIEPKKLGNVLNFVRAS